jgi:hypothetical protein
MFIVTGFLISLSYHYFVGHSLKFNYPYNTFLFRPGDRFGDFRDNFNAGSNPYREIKSSRAMFPFFMLISWLMYLADHKMILLGLYLVIFMFGLSIIMLIFLKKESVYLRLFSVISFLFCSYPVLISFDRANFENGVFLLVFVSVILVQKKNFFGAGIIMGISIALKPYSIFFLPLFLIDGMIAPILIAGGVALFISMASLIILPVQISGALNILQTNLGLYNEVYVVGNEGLYFGTSIFGFLKVLIYWLGGLFNWFSSNDQVLVFFRSIMTPYLIVTILLFTSILLIMLFYQTSMWKKTAILASCLTLLPFIGSAYRMLYFFIPLMLFLVENRQEVKDRFYAIIFGLIMIPTSYIHFIFNPIFLANPGETDDSVLFHPIIITIFLVSLIYDLLSQRKLNEPFYALTKQFQNYFINSKTNKKAI